MMNYSMKTTKALLAVLTSLAAGAALGVIFSSQGANSPQRKSFRKNDEPVNVLARRIDEKFTALEAKLDARKTVERGK